MGRREHQERKATRGSLGCQDPVDHAVSKDSQAHPDQKGPPVLLALTVRRDRKARQDSQEETAGQRHETERTLPTHTHTERVLLLEN